MKIIEERQSRGNIVWVITVGPGDGEALVAWLRRPDEEERVVEINHVVYVTRTREERLLLANGVQIGQRVGPCSVARARDKAAEALGDADRHALAEAVMAATSILDVEVILSEVVGQGPADGNGAEVVAALCRLLLAMRLLAMSPIGEPSP